VISQEKTSEQKTWKHVATVLYNTLYVSTVFKEEFEQDDLTLRVVSALNAYEEMADSEQV